MHQSRSANPAEEVPRCSQELPPAANLEATISDANDSQPRPDDVKGRGERIDMKTQTDCPGSCVGKDECFHDNMTHSKRFLRRDNQQQVDCHAMQVSDSNNNDTDSQNSPEVGRNLSSVPVPVLEHDDFVDVGWRRTDSRPESCSRELSSACDSSGNNKKFRIGLACEESRANSELSECSKISAKKCKGG